ncbi:hypothetical protein JK386_02780 [Nocardioides sp. zg-536]|uniref:Uncharacterized protein n=1 Tax=Nocardioides faecalis TaxID=2803858 RepID=A0A938Y439_9ACTN|nr:hypothetical protein [Nocardioides faecalis]MBS4754095.1 hypothetical protein [Nocardioides faecalis]QVI60547.1 hypothetical protein KG111_08040 [Nocardioides faecalis]
MRGGIWFTAGAAAGVYGVVKARRVAEALTTDGLRDRIGAAVLGARMFRDEVAQGHADAEVRLRQHYRGLEASRTALDAPTPDPTSTTSIETTTTAGPAALASSEEEGPS